MIAGAATAGMIAGAATTGNITGIITGAIAAITGATITGATATGTTAPKAGPPTSQRLGAAGEDPLLVARLVP